MRIVDYSSVHKTLTAYPGLRSIDISESVAFVVKGKGCAGAWQGREYVPCESFDWPHCASCGVPDPCVACRGDCTKPIKTCCFEHSIYIAVFAPDIVKVGTTRSGRLETRLKEQGADMGFEIARLPDGELARKRETAMAISIKDRVTFEEKRQSVSKKINEKILGQIYGSYGIQRAMRLRYFKEDIFSTPIYMELKEGMAVSGRVLGIKGQVLVLEKRGSFYAINLDELIGRDIEQGRGSINLQTSLGEYMEKSSV